MIRTTRLFLLLLLLAVPVVTAAEAERARIEVGELTFDARTGGPPNGELVLLLHGFPETSHSFRHLIGPLASLGYRVVAPDQRGYSPGARPDDVEAYGMRQLVDDVTGIADALGYESFHLIGHDWGGAVAWVTAIRYPERVRSLTVLSTPHPRAFGRALSTPDSDQAKRSSYFSTFAEEGSEKRFLADDARLLKNLLTSPGIHDEDRSAYLEVLGDEDALRAALNWYRALVASRASSSRTTPNRAAQPPRGEFRVPTLYIWGENDQAFGRAAAEASREFVDGYFEFHALPEIGHWIAEDAPEVTNELVIRHLARFSDPARHPGGSGARVSTIATDHELPSNGRLGGVSLGPDGEIYVSNFGGSLWRVDSDGRVTPVLRGLKGTSGNAVDEAGNVYQGSFLDDRIVRVDRDGTVGDWVEEGLSGPVGMAARADGSLYVCNCKDNSVALVSPERVVRTFARSPDFDCPNGIAIDRDGSLIVVSYKNGHVVVVDGDGNARRLTSLPGGGNAHVAVTDAALYVTKIGDNEIYRVTRAGSFEHFAGSGALEVKDGPLLEAGIPRPNGIAATADGRELIVNNLIGAWKGDEPTTIVLRRIQLEEEPSD